MDADGVRVENHSFTPWGEKTPWLSATQTLPETKGWIGERYDEDAGLQYLNARYYDPKLGLFLQPDWFEVAKPGVGTNRYSYSVNDPVNKLDPNGNAYQIGTALVGGLVGVGFQGAIDLWSGELSSKEAYAAAFIGGAVSGATFGLMSPATSTIAKSVVSGVTGSAAGSAVENGEIPSGGEFVVGAIIDAATAGKGSKVVSNITAPRGTVSRSVDDILKPDGQLVGTVNKGATQNIRTVSSSEFTKLKDDLLEAATPGGTYAKGKGQWYDLPNGGRVGVRESGDHGLTLDFDIPGYSKDLKVHQK